MESYKHFTGTESASKQTEKGVAQKQERFKAEKPELFAFFENRLQKIKIEVLADIFSEYKKRSGRIEGGPIVLPSKEAVYLYDDAMQEHDGQYYGSARTIGININGISKEIEKKNSFIPFYHTLVHEYAHAASGMDVWESSRDGKVVDHVRSGVSERRRIDGAIECDLDLFNEGLTEHIAHAVLLEYCRRTGEMYSREDIIAYVQGEFLQDTQYAHGERMVDAFVRAFAETTGVPPDVVWRSLERAYFERSPLLEQIGAALPELVGEELAHSVVTSNDKSVSFDLRLLQALKARPDLVDQWTQYLDNTRGAQ